MKNKKPITVAFEIISEKRVVPGTLIGIGFVTVTKIVRKIVIVTTEKKKVKRN